MKIEDIWNLFKLTGKIEYYLTYKSLKEKGMSSIGDKESNRDYS